MSKNLEHLSQPLTVAGITMAIIFFALAIGHCDACARGAEIDEPRPDVTAAPFATVAVVYPVSLKDGTGLPPGIAHSIGVVARHKSGWGIAGEIGFHAGFVAFRPAPQFVFGPSYRFSPRFVLGASVIYKFTPPYDGAPVGHLVAGTIAPAFPLGDGWTLVFPTGVSYNATADAAAFSVAIKVSKQLPSPLLR